MSNTAFGGVTLLTERTHARGCERCLNQECCEKSNFQDTRRRNEILERARSQTPAPTRSQTLGFLRHARSQTPVPSRSQTPESLKHARSQTPVPSRSQTLGYLSMRGAKLQGLRGVKLQDKLAGGSGVQSVPRLGCSALNRGTDWSIDAFGLRSSGVGRDAFQARDESRSRTCAESNSSAYEESHSRIHADHLWGHIRSCQLLLSTALVIS